MKKTLFVSIPALLIVGFFALRVIADEDLVRFDGGIGVIPVRGSVAALADNVVQGVNPAGVPWVIAGLRAAVKVDGRIRVDGSGLLLAGVNGIGTNGGQSVLARLFCGGIAHDSDPVPLEANGDFRIDDVLTPVPPNQCTNPVLLIVNSGGTVWFAAGIPKD